MKKFFVIFLVLVGVGAYFFFANKSPLVSYKLEGKTYKLLTAKNNTEWTKGLMFFKNKSELNGADGMIFIFPDYDYRSFWNDNTFLNLDVYWILDDEIAGKSFLPSIEDSKEVVIVESKKKVNKVVEIVRH
ncbi:MAG: DUF192 domain-containing protein [Ignavibacteria bacterium]|nr:DUF192 domain-containing protein [Ignavibacteria bacterium]